MAKRLGLDEVREALSCPVASLRTPFKKDGAIDYEGIRRYIDRSIAGGAKTTQLEEFLGQIGVSISE